MRSLGAPSIPKAASLPFPTLGPGTRAGLSPRTPEGGKAMVQATESQDLQGGSGVNRAGHLIHEPQFPRGPDGNARGAGGCVTSGPPSPVLWGPAVTPPHLLQGGRSES